MTAFVQEVSVCVFVCVRMRAYVFVSTMMLLITSGLILHDMKWVGKFYGFYRILGIIHGRKLSRKIFTGSPIFHSPDN